LVFWWSLIGLIVEIPISIFLWTQSRKYVKFSFPLFSPLKYLLGVFVLIIFFLMTSDLLLNYEPSIYDFLPSLLLELILCIGIYVGFTYAIDKDIRKLFKSIIAEIKSIFP